MAAIYFQLSFFTRCSINKSRQESNKQNLHCAKIKGTKNSKMQTLTEDHDTTFSSVAPASADNVVHLCNERIRQNIPTKKQLIDPYRLGMFEGLVFKQTFVIRSHEVGPDQTMTIESILCLLQETSLNHVWMSGLMREYGTTIGMIRNNLIWVLSRLQVQVDHYPIWGEVIEIDTWVAWSGRNGMRRDWLIRSRATGLVLARATSTWAMMNKHTRRLSKMPDEVRSEISPLFLEKKQTIEESSKEIEKLDCNKASHLNSDLKPKRSDLDMNHHVNYVMYVKWMIQSIPDEFLENHQLSNIAIEYRRECVRSDVVQSLCQRQQNATHKNGHIALNGHSLSSSDKLQGPLTYTHLLHVKGDPRNGEIARGNTTWRNKLTANLPFGP